MRGDHVLAGNDDRRHVERLARTRRREGRAAGGEGEREVVGTQAAAQDAGPAAQAVAVPPPPRRRRRYEPRVVRASRYHVKPLSIEAAAIGVETGTDGFLVFRNAGTGPSTCCTAGSPATWV